MRPMTVRDLRAFLANFDDNDPVLVTAHDHSYRTCRAMAEPVSRGGGDYSESDGTPTFEGDEVIRAVVIR